MKITKEQLLIIIQEELTTIQELAPSKGVYAVDDAAIAEAERIEKMYRDKGLEQQADKIRRAISAARNGEVNIEQFHNMYESIEDTGDSVQPEDDAMTDVARVLAYIDKIDNYREYAQLLLKILKHEVKGKELVLKKILGNQAASSILKNLEPIK